MSDNIKTALILIAVVVVAAGAITYGALTPEQKPQQEKPAPTTSASKKPEKTQAPVTTLETEGATIRGVLFEAYPKAKTDYTIKNEKLYGDGLWYGAQLLYKGKDKGNRDTLRVLAQKKDGVWVLRTTPPELLLSTKKYPDAPRDALVDINRAISLP